MRDLTRFILSPAGVVTILTAMFMFNIGGLGDMFEDIVGFPNLALSDPLEKHIENLKTEESIVTIIPKENITEVITEEIEPTYTDVNLTDTGDLSDLDMGDLLTT
ncbi:hypothetical protein KY343_03770 [Candidatus Woesearchaeota archaeon]|nr:hypothetical protein [Candidatus Woesearchaeota archaeon]